MKIIRTVNKANIWRFAYACSAKWLPRSCYSQVCNNIRLFFGRRIATKMGRGGEIERGVTFGERLKVGDRTTLGYFSELYGDITIGNDCLIGPQCALHTSNHGTSAIDIPIRDQPSTPERPIVIEDDCWIGQRAIILPGVIIGAHSIVGAGAVVTKSTPPYSVAVGVPAKVVKRRYDEHE